MKRFSHYLAVAVLMLSLIVTGSASANFPERELTLVVPVAAGGGSDMTMRALAREMEAVLGVPVVVVNRVGAGGAVGLSEVARSQPDGYTMVMITEYNYNLPMTQSVTFTMDSFTPVATVNFDPAAIAVSVDSPWQTIDELIEYATNNPGVVTLGNSGFGNIWHIAATAFEHAVGARFIHVPFNGAAPTITATLGGHVSAMVASPPEMAAQVAAGNLRILSVMIVERMPQFPAVPTLKQKGHDLQFRTWRGIGVPAGVPADRVQIVEEAVKAAVESEGFQAFMARQGLGILWRDSAETLEYMKADEPRFRTLLESMGLLRN